MWSFTRILFLLLIPCIVIPPGTSTPTISSAEAQNCDVDSSSGGSLVFHKQTGKCYDRALIGSKGPCGPLMNFTLSHEGGSEAECTCKKFYNDGCPARPLVRDLERNACFPIYERGFCPDGEWLGADEQGNARCEPNLCKRKDPFAIQTQGVDSPTLNLTGPYEEIEKVPSEDFRFPYQGKCYTSYSKAFCSDQNTDPENPEKGVKIVVFFIQGSFTPQCGPKEKPEECLLKTQSSYHLGIGGPLRCPPGMRQTSMGDCSPIASF